MSDNAWEAYHKAHREWVRATDATKLATVNVDRARTNLSSAITDEQKAYEAMVDAGRAAGVPFNWTLRRFGGAW